MLLSIFFRVWTMVSPHDAFSAPSAHPQLVSQYFWENAGDEICEAPKAPEPRKFFKVTEK